jgi:small subunit ribosomal protein S4e
MSHLKRSSIERSWPLPKKGTKYLLKAHPGKKAEISMPLGIMIRDVMKIAGTRKEVKSMLHSKEVSVDGKIITEEKFPVGIFDIMCIKKLNKNFMITLNENGKIGLDEISDKETGQKICKVIGKKVLKKGISQINCIDGRNFISKEKLSTNDSVIIDLKESKISKVLPLKAGAEILITGGEHIGEKGKIIEKNEKIKVQIKGKNFEIHAKNIYVIK